VRRMFVPNVYREPHSSWTTELVKSNPLGVLVTADGGAKAPYATHLPIIFDPQSSEQSELDNATLLGHMNRANPHWKALELDEELQALLIFAGPNGYVSPSLYGLPTAAPTWDFTSVHVRGTLRRIESAEETFGVIKATARAFEHRFGNGWDMNGSLDYFRRILPGVGAFRIKVTCVESMFKLSQEQPPRVREQVRESFARNESSDYRDLAGLMHRLPHSNLYMQKLQHATSHRTGLANVAGAS
jgi:transcriptional regulator